MISTIPRTYRRISDGYYPVPDWKNPDPALHEEVFLDDPPVVPDGSVAELSEQPDEQNILRYTIRAKTQDELDADVPHSVTRLQGLLAIAAAGLTTAYLNWRNSLDPVDDFAAIAFCDAALTWHYDDPVLTGALAAVAPQANKADLFRLAATL